MLNEKRKYKDTPFDIFPLPRASLATLSRPFFEQTYLPQAFTPEVLEANDRSYEQRLAACKMIVSLSPSPPAPTVLGLLTIGKNPQDYIYCSTISFLRIDGGELSDDVMDEQNIGGALADMLRRAEEKMATHNRSAVDIVSAPTHLVSWDYPMPAIRQLLRNAVLHRSYESTNAPVRVYWFNDRIEIISPGGPYGNVTEANFGNPGVTSYRNPNIADVLKTLGFIEAFGRGIAIARKALEENGNPPPEFTVNSSNVMAVIWRKNAGQK